MSETRGRALLRAAGLAGALALLAGACGGDGGGSGGDAAPQSGGSQGEAGTPDPTAVIRAVAPTHPPLHMDPVRAISRCEIQQLASVYDTLVWGRPDGTVAPGLAESWDASDPNVLELTLRSGVSFSDGTPFDAEAVKAHIERAKSHPQSTISSALTDVEEVEVVSGTVLRLHLSRPRAGVLLSVLSEQAGMVPAPAAVAAAGDDYGVDGAVGAGPFLLEELRPDEFLSVRASDTYWNAAENQVAGFDLTYAAELHQDLLLNGEYDYAAVRDVSYQEVVAAAERGELEYALDPTPQFGHIFLNTGREPFDDVRVRQALNHAVDREVLTEVLTGGAGTPAYSPIPSGSWAYDDAVEDLYPHDPERARELLEEAGFADGLSMRVATIESPYYARFAQAVQDMLRDSNIDVELVPVSGSEINTVLYVEQEYDAAFTAYSGSSDPGLTLESRYSATGTSNPSGVTTPEIEELLAEGAATTDPDARAEAYRAAQVLVMEEALEVPIYHNGGLVIFNSRVDGVEHGLPTCAWGNFHQVPTMTMSAES